MRDVELLTKTRRSRGLVWTFRPFCGECAAMVLDDPIRYGDTVLKDV